MDDEELDLGTTGKKITVNNFFESIRDIDQVASDATKSILRQGVTIEGIIKSISKIEKEIIEIKSFIRIQKDLEEDRLLEAQDAAQKDQRRLELESEFGGEKNKKEKSKKDQNAPGDFGLNAQEKAAAAAAATTTGGGSISKGIIGQLPALIGSILNPFAGFSLFAEGGKVNDTDNDKTNNNEDSVPALLTPGEFVITKDAVKKVGVDTLKGINAAAGGENKPKLLEGTIGKGPAAKLGVMSKEFLGFGEDGDMETAERSMRRDEEGHVEKTYFDGSTDIYEQTADDGSSYFYDKSEMIGSSLKEESISRYNNEETFEDGTKETFTRESILKSQIIDIAVDDMITHKNQLMSEVNKLEGFEKVTFKQILNGTHGIPNELLFPVLAKSNASKATAKKKDKAEKLDREQGIQPRSAYKTLGYRINQINPTSFFRSQESLDEKSRLDFKYDSKNDPTLAKGKKRKKGVKGFSEGGLVGEDIVGEKLKNFAEQFKMDENMNVNFKGLLGEEKGKKMNKVFGGFLNMIKDDVIPNVKEEKLESGAKTILQKGLSSMPVDNISDKIEKSDMPEGVKALFTDIFGGDKIEKMIEGVSTDMEGIDIFDSLIPLVEEVQSAGEGDAPPPSSESPNKNQPVLIQKSPPNVSEAEIKNSAVEEVIPFINTISNKELSTFSNEGLANFIK